jgi:uncharacterized protein with GYD domain
VANSPKMTEFRPLLPVQRVCNSCATRVLRRGNLRPVWTAFNLGEAPAAALGHTQANERKGRAVPKYLLQVNYTLEGVKGVLAKGGSARKTAAQAAAKSAGGKVESFHFALGPTDVFLIADLPDNAAAAALA